MPGIIKLELNSDDYFHFRKTAADWGCSVEKFITVATRAKANEHDFQRWHSRYAFADSKPIGRDFEDGEEERVREMINDAINGGF